MLNITIISLHDPDVHMRPAIEKNRDKYYEYMIANVGDLPSCSVNPKLQRDMIQGNFSLKDGTVEEPKMYLGGADIIQSQILMVLMIWRGFDYLWLQQPKPIRQLLMWLGTKEYGFTLLPKNVTTHVVAGYQPEINLTPELDQRKQNYYQGF